MLHEGEQIKAYKVSYGEKGFNSGLILILFTITAEGLCLCVPGAMMTGDADNLLL